MSRGWAGLGLNSIWLGMSKEKRRRRREEREEGLFLKDVQKKKKKGLNPKITQKHFPGTR